MSNVTLLSLAIAITPILASIGVYIIQNATKKRTFFNECAKSLNSSNEIEQITAAILLRSFIKKRSYSKETKHTIVALLRNPSLSVSLQKTLADGFSYADTLKGQDFQDTNMLNALIKPESRVKYELSGKVKYKHDRLSMRQADCYRAIMQECNISNVDATKSVFYCTNLIGTSFRNCLFEGANFKCANLKNVVFDEDCVLENASFEHAVGLSQAFVKERGGKDKDGKASVEKKPLVDYLDKNGVFHHKGEGGQYENKNSEIKLFVSKLGAMDSKQMRHYDSIISMLKDCFDKVELEHIDRDKYHTAAQLSDVMSHMDGCDGCVIFAFEYLSVERGCLHKDMISDDRKQMDNMVLPSPWLHIEAAIANGKEIPCLIIYDQDLYRDGMFDDKIVYPDINLYSLEYSDTIRPTDTIIERWRSRVQEYFHSRKRRC